MVISAAKAAMAFLKNGGTAVDAVEVAIMVLEDSAITNAGYGSNLNVDGVVECDATIMDHCGRSGAVGAVPSKLTSQFRSPRGSLSNPPSADIKNPIMLARKVFDRLDKPMGMSRVPPNFLVGEGAKEFAWNQGLVIVPDDVLITPVSMERWKSWVEDIKKYDHEHSKSDSVSPWFRRPPTPISTRVARAELPSLQNKIEADIAATREVDNEVASDRLKTGKCLDGDSPKAPSVPDQKQHDPGETQSTESGQAADLPSAADLDSGNSKPIDGSGDIDMVSDTVGAIAIDKFGNIAAGSSSGGIGMKHQGRIGPAALIGIGTHVIPVDPTDPEGTAVAVVTSGTGEHIATTLSASTCALRVLHCQRKGDFGTFEIVTEDEALRSMISKEFSGTFLHSSCIFMETKSSCRSSGCEAELYLWCHWDHGCQADQGRHRSLLCAQHRVVCKSFYEPLTG